MKDSGIDKEMHFLSHLVTIITMTVFSGVLILLDIILDWEKWMIPVIIAGLLLCLSVHISGKGSGRTRIYCYAVFLIFETFYYAVSINTLYDSTALIVIMVFIFSMSGERFLVAVTTCGGLAGMILHLLIAGGEGKLKLDASNIVRSAWQFLLIVLGAVLADRMSSAWFNTEKQYRHRIDDILEENERANNFLANVSHEIRTPVNAVMGLASIMEKEDVPERFRGNVSAIAEAGHRVADQVGDIMDYTEIDMKKLAVSRERYTINSVVGDIITQLRFTEDYGLDLVVDLSPDVPAELIGDCGKIKKILRHLITNGFKFTRSGGVRVRICTKKRDYGINLILEVTDTGIGMSGSEIEHIYEKFYQADSGRSRTAGGLGLGIPIVNGLARAMDGFVHIESAPEEGTVVRVSIPQEISDGSPCITVANRDSVLAAGFFGFLTTKEPRVKEFYMEMITNFVTKTDVSFRRVGSLGELERLVVNSSITHLFIGTGEYIENKDYIDLLAAEMNVVLIEDRDFRGEVGENIAVLRKPFSGAQLANYLEMTYVSSPKAEKERMFCPDIRVLAVDDEPMNLHVAKGIFETYGMRVSTALSGAEAIEMCMADDFDIIFMDHMMPEMDGVETAKRIRQSAGRLGRDICIVALTANVSSSAKDMFLSEGFDAFLPKPIDLMELDRVLKRVLPRSAIVYDPLSADSGDDTEPPVPADPYRALREFGVDIGEGMGYCQNDEGFYREILAEFADRREEKLGKLNGYFADKALKDYAIRVHSIKSTAKTIGADALSESAKRLEAAAKSGDERFIAENHEAFAKDYGRLLQLINELTGDSKEA